MVKSLQHKKYRKTIAAGSVVFLLCVLVCWWHVRHIQTVMRETVMEISQSTCGIGTQILEERFAGYRDLVEQGALRIENISFKQNERISGILHEYEDAGKFQQVYYYDTNGVLLLSSGQRMTAVSSSDSIDFDSLDFSKGAVITARFDKNQTPQDILAIAPVIRDEQTVGYLMGSRQAAGEQLVPVRDYFGIHPVFYIVREDGQIISKYTGLGEEVEELEDVSNINLALEGIEHQKHAEEQSVLRMGEDLKSGSAGNVSLSFKQGVCNLIYTPMKNPAGWSLITVIPDESVRTLARTGQHHTILVCTLLLLLALLLVVFMSLQAIRAGQTMDDIVYSDDLTSARNMNYFQKRAAQLIATEKNLPYVIARFDISGFRYINEAFGHERGNEILRMIALYGEETFGSKEVFARNTADQFVILMVELEDIVQRMDRFSERVNEYARNIDVSFPIILRTGYYRVKEGDSNIAEMIDKANVARKTIQRDAKLWTVDYTEQMQTDIRVREEIESAMVPALEHGEFQIYLQPKYDILENKIAGAEALVRWIKADGTIVYPDQFIPVFEQNGFIERLDFYMLEEICRKIRSMQKEGLEIVPISVNQSRILLMNPDYVRKVQRILKKYSVPKDSIELELTETVFFDEKERIISVMNELKQDDVVWDIDDFGSGFSSLNLLKDVPFDCLKIDRGFFSETADSETSKLILRKIVEMADGLHVQCICEGVETKEQVELLRSIGCRYAQGFLYSRPIPLKEFIEKYVTR